MPDGASAARSPNKKLPAHVQRCPQSRWPLRRCGTYALHSKRHLFEDFRAPATDVSPGARSSAGEEVEILISAFSFLAYEKFSHVGITLSFSTVERFGNLIASVFERERLLAHRVCVILSGSLERVDSPGCLIRFIRWLRQYRVSIGYQLSDSCVFMQSTALDVLSPDFIKVAAPASTAAANWRNVLLELRAIGQTDSSIVVSGLDTQVQMRLALQTGFRLGQGDAADLVYKPRPASPPTWSISLPADKGPMLKRRIEPATNESCGKPDEGLQVITD